MLNKIKNIFATFINRLSISGFVGKWIFLGIILGFAAGFGAILFYITLELSTKFFLGWIAGYSIPTPYGEGNSLGSSHFVRPWAIPLVVGVGGLISGFIVYFLAREAEGHGTDAAIEAVHHNPKGIRIRAIVAKILASAVMIGSGGSGGREGPSAQISAGIGSLFARIFKLSEKDSKVAVSIGIGSGIGSIFGAPLGGAVLSGEILYRDDIEGSVIVPALLASAIGYLLFGFVEGFKPLFGAQAANYQFTDIIQIFWFAVLGIFCGAVGFLYCKIFYWTVDCFNSLKIPFYYKPLIGGVVVGLTAMFVPEVLGTGYGWIQQVFDYHQLKSIPIVILISLPLLRILATSFSIGSGGSGGIFGPGMVIGAFTGASFWSIINHVVTIEPHNPAPFIIVGMLACFGSVAQAPIAVTLMVLEMTGNITVLVPAVTAIAIASFIVKKSGVTIYPSQLENRYKSDISNC